MVQAQTAEGPGAQEGRASPAEKTLGSGLKGQGLSCVSQVRELSIGGIRVGATPGEQSDLAQPIGREISTRNWIRRNGRSTNCYPLCRPPRRPLGVIALGMTENLEATSSAKKISPKSTQELDPREKALHRELVSVQSWKMAQPSVQQNQGETPPGGVPNLGCSKWRVGQS